MEETQVSKKKHWCITQTKTVSVSFKWTITNFSFHVRQPGYSLKSSSFSSEVDSNQWNLVAYPKGLSEDTKNYFALYLDSPITGSEVIKAKFQCSILDNSGKIIKTMMSCVRQFARTSNEWGWPKFILLDVLRNVAKLLHNDTLIIQCTVDQIIQSFNTSGKEDTATIPQSRLKNDLFHLYEQELLTDVVLSVHGKQFKVHKTILAARSPVFAAMFTTDMQEKNQDVVELSDMDADVLYNMIYFMYTGDALEMTTVKLASDLLAAADKYDLERLKLMCAEALCPKMTVDNVSEVIVLADFHRSCHLKKRALDFIHHRMSLVTKTEQWMMMMRDHPNLSNEVFQYHLQYEQNGEVNN